MKASASLVLFAVSFAGLLGCSGDIGADALDAAPSSGTGGAAASTSASTSATGGGAPEPDPGTFLLEDPLTGTTLGNQVGGSLGADGWTVTDVADRIWYAVPRLVEGSFQVTMSGVTHANLDRSDHELMALYEAGFGIEQPIPYNPEFRENNFKAMLRVYGTPEADRVGQQKLMWGMCPAGAPGYGGPCPCGTSFFEEPFGGDGAWDGTAQVLRIEWGNGLTRLLRNGVEVLAIDWSQSGVAYGPSELQVSIGTPRPEDVDSAAMPIGAVFRDLVVEGKLGGDEATCPGG